MEINVNRIIKRLVYSFKPVVGKPKCKEDEEYYEIKEKIVAEIWEVQKPFIENSLTDFLKNYNTLIGTAVLNDREESGYERDGKLLDALNDGDFFKSVFNIK